MFCITCFCFVFFFQKKKQHLFFLMLFIGLKKGYDNNGASDQFVWFLHWTQYRYVWNQDQRVSRQDLNSSMENRTKFLNFTDFSTGTSNPLAPSFFSSPTFFCIFPSCQQIWKFHSLISSVASNSITSITTAGRGVIIVTSVAASLSLAGRHTSSRGPSGSPSTSQLPCRQQAFH